DLPRLHDAGVGGDAGLDLARAHPHAHRARHPGRAHAPADGRGARPQRAARVHAGVRRRCGTRRTRRRDRRQRLRHGAGHGGLGGATAAVFIVAPLVFTSSFALTMLTQMGSFIIFALSYNMLLGQSGMLSFGHAVYSGLGAYIAAHALNLMGKGAFAFPVTLLPLIGGLAGMLFGVMFGYVTTRRAGTTFALISLGVGEMVFACVLMFPGFFGGEAGISTNRVVGKAFLGVSYG